MTTESRLLGGRYELGEVLGYGGMAEVHRGRDVRLGRDVAIKLLRSDLARDPSFQSRFRREAQSAASLNHPSIVAVYDTGEDSTGDTTTPYIVMEYVEGRTLRDVLEADGRMLPQRALEFTAQVCAALEQAHRSGIVHRDIKPGNVMLTPSGEVKVMDFGIARALTGTGSTMTQTAAIVGTAHYLSPEQARGEHVDARSDIYSTGCLLYELLTGAPPFTGESAVAIAYQHVREDPVPPSQVERDVSAAVDSVVLKAMAKNPAHRYQSAADLRADIERALAGRPVEATPVVPEDHTSLMPPPATTVLLRQQQPRRGRAAAYALLGLATLAVFVIALLVARGLFAAGSGDINTPNVVGRTLADAQTILAGKGLKVGKVTQQYNANVTKGQVFKQDPAADILLRKGDSVAIWVSLGVKYVQVPGDLVGMPQDQAKVVLQAAGLKVGQVVPRNSGAAQGQVLDTNPAAGASVPEGSEVTLYVSNAQVKVPDVVGKDVNDATAMLQRAGFQVDARPTAPQRKKDINHVVSENPPGGSYAQSGSTVVILYGAEPSPSQTPTPSESPTPTPTPSETTTSPPPPSSSPPSTPPQ